MRPRLILLLALVALTVTFMAFLVKDQGEKKIVCTKGVCTEQQPPTQPTGSSGGGGEEMDNGSFHHLIVSTIK